MSKFTEGGEFVTWNDPQGNPLISINRDGTISCLGVSNQSGQELTPLIQYSSVKHTVTQTEVTQGFCAVPVTWPEPFADDNYLLTSEVSDPIMPLTLDYAIGDVHYQTAAGATVVIPLLGAVALVQGQYDNFNDLTADSFSFTPLASQLYQISVYINPKNAASGGNNFPNFLGDTIQMLESYTGEGTDGVINYYPSDLVTTREDGVRSNTSPIYAKAGQPVTVSTQFTVYHVVGTGAGSFYGPGSGVPFVQANTGATGLEMNTVAYTSISAVTVNSATQATLTVDDASGQGYGFQIGASVYIAGLTGAGAQLNGSSATVTSASSTVAISSTTGTGTVGEIVLQTGTGATGMFVSYAGGTLTLSHIDGSPNDTGVWIGQTSGATFTPSASPMAGTTIVIAGTGWTTGTATGQSGTISEFMYISNITGTPNNHDIWTDTVNGGTFTPATSLPTLDTFPYHLSIRIVQMPVNSAIVQAGFVFTLNSVGIHP